MIRPGRLHRTLRAAGLPTPHVTVTLGSTATLLQDDEISSIVIHRGTNGADEGMHPATAEIAVPHLVEVRTGMTLNVDLSVPAADALAARLGGTRADYRRRFTGRLGRQSVHDTGRRQTTTIMGSSWTSQLAFSRRVSSIPAGTDISTMIRMLVSDPVVAGRYDYQGAATGIATTEDAVGRFSDLESDYISGIGLSLLENRNGDLRLVSWANRFNEAVSAAQYAPPVTRSQAISPATWDQPSEIVSTNYVVRFQEPDGTIIRRTADLGSPITSPEETLDWTHIRMWDRPESQWRHIEALESREYDQEYLLRTITVDLLLLLASPLPYHARVLAYLLKLEAGQPVTLSGDWHPDLQGVHFATGISEKLTSNSWELTLTLAPHRHIVGAPSPPVRAFVWDQIRSPWNAASFTWHTDTITT